ncbi:MAG: arylsulfatase [Acidimicrobiales bacterium]
MTAGDSTAPYAGFEGRVGRTVAGSESWWPTPATPPPGAPNVIVMMADDLGFSDLGCYGSEIDTPNLDRLAAEGLRYRDYHATPMCSPTRAALLTGLNPHNAGIGHVAHSDPGFPGYVMEITQQAATLPEIFGDHGYFTAMVGKWHLTKDSHNSDAGPFDSWPVQRGFNRFYGILDGFTNLHQPHRIVEDNHALDIDRYPDGYYFTDDICDRALAMIRSTKASRPDQPFFLYFSHGSVHAPLHAKPADIEKYRGRYDAGWDALRLERFERMKAMGVIPADTVLPPRNSEPGNDVRPWEDVPLDEQRLASRYMEVYAAMVDNIDQNFGRLRAELERLGEWDNTIVIFTSDNGASREGEVEGTTGYFVHLLGQTDLAADLARIDEIGGPTTIPHYPRGFAMACGTPFRLYKINTHAGGHQVPMIIRAPGHLTDPGAWRDQYTYVTDMAPTLLELCGLAKPDERNGHALKPFDGTSFVATLDDADAPTAHTEQYTEMIGHRGYYRDGWEAVTLHQPLTEFGDHEWELYDLTTDPTETTDLAERHPDRVAELAAAWEQAAWDNQVYPLDEGSAVKFLIRPPWDEVFSRPVTILPGTPTLERWRCLQLIMIRAFTISIVVTVADGDEGVLVAHGDQGGGYLVWLDAGGLHVAHNDGRGRVSAVDAGALAVGDHKIVVEVTAPGGNVWDVAVLVDGERRGSATGWTCLFPMAPFQGIDVGIDRRSPVLWSIYEEHGPYPFTGAIDHVTYTPGPPAPDAPQNMVELLRSMGARFE